MWAKMDSGKYSLANGTKLLSKLLLAISNELHVKLV